MNDYVHFMIPGLKLSSFETLCYKEGGISGSVVCEPSFNTGVRLLLEVEHRSSEGGIPSYRRGSDCSARSSTRIKGRLTDQYMIVDDHRAREVVGTRNMSSKRNDWRPRNGLGKKEFGSLVQP